MNAIGAGLGLAAAAGLLLVWVGLPVRRRAVLDQRLAPYLAGIVDQARTAPPDRTVTPLPTLERVVRPYLTRGADLLERVLGGTASVRRRLQQSGSTLSVHEFRVEQVLWAAVAFAAAVVVSLLMRSSGEGSPPALVMMCVAAAVAGVMARDYRLTRAVKTREDRMLAEFPVVADLLALAVTAGEGPVGALERVSRVSSGELARELGRALSDARAGASLAQALDGVADRTSLPALARFADGITVAVERGTPLADVLRAQAADVREARRRHLMEIGGRKEIAMLVPVVFLVLPVTVLFALYPGLVQISAVVP